MSNTNVHFPIINYAESKGHFEWGLAHGEEFRTAISELALIRKNLMLQKKPKLKSKLDELAHMQFNISKNFSPFIADEIAGITKGSNLNLTDIVILNNYTDFRDLELPEEGCSTIHCQKNNSIFAGQTWDMHRSAKNYMCLLDIKGNQNSPAQIVLTLVGCVGLMGINQHNCMIGVNNINTKNAKIGLIWPLLVRDVLLKTNLNEMRNTLLNSPVTSGHNYLISSLDGGEHLEITPEISETVSQLKKSDSGVIFHTNHCLGLEIEKLEDKNSLSSTTFNRFEIIEKNESLLNSCDDLENLLKSHDGFPKSICSHSENGTQDPSFTCGGGVCDFNQNTYKFWRGCKTHDHDFKEHIFKLEHFKFYTI